MNRKMWMTALAASGLAVGLVFGASASAATISCGPYTVEDATANGAFADDCASVTATPPKASSGDQLNFVNTDFGPDWTYIGKYNDNDMMEDQDSTGYLLSVTGFEDGKFTYSLQLLDAEPETVTTIEWVLGVFQATNFTAYYWESVTLDVGGTFVSTFTPPEADTNAFSHISGFVRGEKTTEVPEPAALAMLGGGLLALGWAMRRRSRSGVAE